MKAINIAMQCNVNENLEMKNSLRSIFFAARDQSYLRKEKSFSFVSIFLQAPTFQEQILWRLTSVGFPGALSQVPAKYLDVEILMRKLGENEDKDQLGPRQE